jgi:hypothetical protein
MVDLIGTTAAAPLIEDNPSRQSGPWVNIPMAESM